MLLRLRKHESAADLESVLALASELGYQPRFLDRERRLLELTAEGRRGGRPGDRSSFEDLAIVESVLDSSDAPELALRAPDRAPNRAPDRPPDRTNGGDTVVRAGAAVFGGGSVALIAGPCAIEDEERLCGIARAVKAAGATLLRGGAFKPRTSPYSFQGLGRAGLERLARVKAAVDVGVVTEVLDPRDVEAVCEVADMLQVGSRSMSNFALLREVGRAGRPVLLKRGMAATAREFLLAAEYVLAAGNGDVVLCERGVRGFDDVTRNVLDLGTVAHLKRTTHLPVIVDPSHAAGRADLVAPLAKAGIVAGADGLIVEVHPDPTAVRSDGAQAVSPRAFREIVDSVATLVELEGRVLARTVDAHRPYAAV